MNLQSAFELWIQIKKKKSYYRSAKQVPLQQTNKLKNFAIKKKKSFILYDLGSLFFRFPLEYLQAHHFRHVASDNSGRIIFIFTWVNLKIKDKNIFVDPN